MSGEVMMMRMIMMMIMMMTSLCVLWGQGVQPNFLAAECATNDCRGKQPDHNFHDHFDDNWSYFDDKFDDDHHYVHFDAYHYLRLPF